MQIEAQELILVSAGRLQKKSVPAGRPRCLHSRSPRCRQCADIRRDRVVEKGARSPSGGRGDTEAVRVSRLVRRLT